MSLISKKILNPDNFFRPVPMWYLNGKLDEDETRRQIAEVNYPVLPHGVSRVCFS